MPEHVIEMRPYTSLLISVKAIPTDEVTILTIVGENPRIEYSIPYSIFDRTVLSANEIDAIARAFEFIPPNITTVNFTQNSLNGLPSKAIKKILAALPANIGKVALSSDCLNERNLDNLIEAISEIPLHIRDLSLRENSLRNLSVDKLASFLSELPLHITSLDLSDNYIGLMDPDAISDIFKALPDGITSLDLSQNEFSGQRAHSFKSLKNSIKILNLSSNHELTNFADILSAIPRSLTNIDLSGNTFNRIKDSSEFEIMMKSIPENITTLHLNDNDLISKSQLEVEFEEEIAALEEENERIDDDENVTLSYSSSKELVLDSMLTSIPAHVTSLSLQANNEGYSNLVRPCFSRRLAAIPNTINQLDLSYNNLGLLEEPLWKIFANIPDSVAVLNLHNNELGKLSSDNLALAFKHTPSRVSSLDLSFNDLWNTQDPLSKAFPTIATTISSLILRGNHFYKIDGTELGSDLKSIPAHVTSLDLSYNNLAKQTNLLTTLKSIPQNIKTLDLSGNKLGLIAETDLGEIFAAIPNSVSCLKFQDNLLFKKNDTNWNLVFESIPGSITLLDLSGNKLGLMSNDSLVSMFKALPSTVSCLKLQDNLLFNKNGEKLAEMLAAIPGTITSLDLSKNLLGIKTDIELYHAVSKICRHPLIDNKPNFSLSLSDNSLFNKAYRKEEDIDPFLAILRVGMNNGPGEESTINLSLNGLSDLQLAFAPLISLCRQKGGLSEDLLALIMSFLVKNTAGSAQGIIKKAIVASISRAESSSESKTEDPNNSNQTLMLSNLNTKHTIDQVDSRAENAHKKPKHR